MVAPAFGFSVGDFLGALHVARKIIKAARDTETADRELGLLYGELDALHMLMTRLQQTEDEDMEPTIRDEIHFITQLCKIPVERFTVKVIKLDDSMTVAPGTKPSFLRIARSARARVQWSLKVKKAAAELKSSITPNLMIIASLLLVHQESLNDRAHKVLEERQALMRKELVRMQAMQQNILATVSSVPHIYELIRQTTSSYSAAMPRSSSLLPPVVSNTISQSPHSVPVGPPSQESFNELKKRILKVIAETIALLVAIPHALAAMHRLLLRPSPRPNEFQQEPIHLGHAGCTMRIPWEYFSNNSILKAYVKEYKAQLLGTTKECLAAIHPASGNWTLFTPNMPPSQIDPGNEITIYPLWLWNMLDFVHFIFDMTISSTSRDNKCEDWYLNQWSHFFFGCTACSPPCNFDLDPLFPLDPLDPLNPLDRRISRQLHTGFKNWYLAKYVTFDETTNPSATARMTAFVTYEPSGQPVEFSALWSTGEYCTPRFPPEQRAEMRTVFEEMDLAHIISSRMPEPERRISLKGTGITKIDYLEFAGSPYSRLDLYN